MDNDMVGGDWRTVDGDGRVIVGLRDQESPWAGLMQDFIGLYSLSCGWTIWTYLKYWHIKIKSCYAFSILPTPYTYIVYMYLIHWGKEGSI